MHMCSVMCNTQYMLMGDKHITVDHFCFARDLFLRKFAIYRIRKLRNHANIFCTEIILC